MARFRNDHGEDHVCPTLGYRMVPAGETIDVPDDEAHHWFGGWTRIDDNPAVAPAKTTKTAAAAAPEGAEQ